MNISNSDTQSNTESEFEKHSLIGKSFKSQLEELDKLIEVTKSGTNTQIETDQENLIAIAPIKAMKGKLKCFISKSNDNWLLKLKFK